MDKTKKYQINSELTCYQWDTLESFVFDQLIATGQPQSKMTIALVLFVFGNRFSLGAMFRFFEWAQGQSEDPEWIFANIMHDLNGRHEDPAIFSPRTSSY